MDIPTAIGLAAASLTTFSMVPQILRVWRVKETRDLSLVMYILISSGLALWLVYGLMKSDIVIILANTLSLGFSLTLLGMKLRYG